MTKRLYELAKELNLSSKDLQEKVREHGLDIDVANHLVGVSDEDEAAIRQALTQPGEPKKKQGRKVVGSGVIRRRARRKVVAGDSVEDVGAASPRTEETEEADIPAAGVVRRRRVVAPPEESDAPAAEAPAEETAPAADSEEAPATTEDAPRKRSRFATVQTRPAEAPAEVVAEEEAVAEAEVADAVVAEEEAQAPAPEKKRSRFATVHTRATEEPAADEPAAEQRRPSIATVVTSSTDENSDAGLTPMELAAVARREADEAERTQRQGKSPGGARVVGTMNPDILNDRIDQRRPRGPAGRKTTGGRDKRSRRVVQGRELYGGGQGARKGRRNKRQRQPQGGGQSTRITTAAEHKRVVKMEEAITVSDLAMQMAIKAGDLVMKLAFELGLRGATLNTAIDFETAELLAEQFNHSVEQVGFDIESYLPDYDDSEETLTARPPVVTVMGHVDHGKTSLLDAIRDAAVQGDEAGGITQHIGAYSVDVGDDRSICFLDTPGHEAFTALRARGAKATDIVILVVAADDGVMPQTVEAINHAREAEVPIIVAVNKIDKPGANVERVKQALTEYELVPEEWGGETLFVEISALRRTNIDGLLETISLQADLLEFKANHDRAADGLVIESRLDTGRGPVATVLVQSGTLSQQDIVVTGEHYGRIRTMNDDRGRAMTSAGPSTPVEITGLGGVPASGQKFYVVKEEKAARAVAEHIAAQNKKSDMAQSATVAADGDGASIEDLIAAGDVKELKIIVKGDVQGSTEAVSQALRKLGDESDEVSVRIIHAGVGSITETDVNLAASSSESASVMIVGFNVRPEMRAVQLAEQHHVRIMTRSIIYEVLDEVREMLGGLLSPIFEEEVIGHAEVRATFNVSRLGTIAGCMVTDGVIRRNGKARVLRDNRIVYESSIGSLRHFDKDEREVKSGYECGLSIERFNDVKEGDVIECYVVHERAGTL